MESDDHPPSKQPRLMDASSADRAPKHASSANIIIQFTSPEGESTGPQLDVPHNVTPKQLETLLNGLLQHAEDERHPYSFFVDEQELASELGEHLERNKASVETALSIVYQPQAIFRVRPVARCSASMPGHSDAVLIVAFSPDGRRLASGGGDCTLRFWDLGTQTPQFRCEGHVSWVLAIAWAPDATMVASGDRNGGIWLWNPATGKSLGRCQVRQVLLLFNTTELKSFI